MTPTDLPATARPKAQHAGGAQPAADADESVTNELAAGGHWPVFGG
jgi:hypothetical protein